MVKGGKRKLFFQIAAALALATGVALVFIHVGPQFRKPGKAEKIKATGTIEATEVDVASEVGGKVISLKTDEGMRIERGEVVAELDKSQLEAEVFRAVAALATARSNLRDFQAGARPQELEQGRASVELARAKLELDESNWRRAKNLFEQGTTSENERDAALANRDVSQRHYEVAVGQLRLLEAGTRPDRIEAAGAEVKQAEAALQLAKVRLGKALIHSPIAGTVLVKDVEEGEVVSPGMPIVTIADLDDMWVKIYIDEIDVGKIKLGQEVLVQVDAFPSREFAGQITYISDEAEFTPKNIQTREDRVKLVFAVKVGITHAGGLLKPGMYADIAIDTAFSDSEEQQPAPEGREQ